MHARPRFMAITIALISLGAGNSCTHGLAELSPEVQELQQHIAGREDQPAEQVFENIRIMNGMPAERVLKIMTNGFSPALGVRCGHCHVEGDFASDEKKPKRIAREMWRMTGEINQEVGQIVGEGARVSCTTCHRGQTAPAVEM